MTTLSPTLRTVRHRHRRMRRLGVPIVVLTIGVAVPLVLPDFEVGLLSLWLPLVILAVSIDLLWGENRVISFGHGAFFAGGGYIAGLLLKGPTSDTTGTNMDLLADASSERGFDRLVETLSAPTVMGVPVLAIVIAPIVCASVGWLIGRAVFRLRSVEIYTPLITLGIGVISTRMYLRTSEIGGSNGLSGIPRYTRDLSDAAEISNYLFNLTWVVVVYVMYALFRRSRSGRRWRAAGDDPIRLEALGEPVPSLRAAGFAASTGLAGLAGAIYVGSSGFMSADFAGVAFSVQAVIWVAVGGPGTLAGPLLGVLAIKYGEHQLNDRIDEYWPLVLGCCLIVVVLLAPRGLAGVASDIRDRWYRARGTTASLTEDEHGPAPPVVSLERTSATQSLSS